MPPESDPVSDEQRLMALRLVMALSVVAVIIGLFTARHTSKWLDGAVRTEGRIVDMFEEHGQEAILYTPIFEFTDATGQVRQVRSSYGSSSPAGQVGDRVPILYRPDRPDSAEVDDFVSIWAMTLGFLGLGSVVLLASGVTALLLARRMR